MRLELLVVAGGGEHRYHHQAAVFQVETGPIPHATPDVIEGGLEERFQKGIALCRRLTVRVTKYALTDRCPGRPCVLCRLPSFVHRGSSTIGLTGPIYADSIGLSSPILLRFGHGESHGERARTGNGEGTGDARADRASRSRARRREGHRRHEPR